jgi:zinc and cadmium transporter
LFAFDLHQLALPLFWLPVIIAASLGTLVSLGFVMSLSSARIARCIQPMVSLSAGVLLATSLLHLLPEAVDLGLDYHALFAGLLGGILFFFILEKFAIFRHSHHHEHDGHNHGHGFDKKAAGRGGMVILVGGSIHNFADGLLIAGAFLVNPQLGWLTTFSIILHEIPQQTGDFIVLMNAGLKRQRALVLMAATGFFAVLGAILGFTVLSTWQAYLPWALVVAAASFLYVAVADLIPQMQEHVHLKATAIQLLCIALGVAVVAYSAQLLHHH